MREVATRNASVRCGWEGIRSAHAALCHLARLGHRAARQPSPIHLRRRANHCRSGSYDSQHAPRPSRRCGPPCCAGETVLQRGDRKYVRLSWLSVIGRPPCLLPPQSFQKTKPSAIFLVGLKQGRFGTKEFLIKKTKLVNVSRNS